MIATAPTLHPIFIPSAIKEKVKAQTAGGGGTV